MPLEPGQLGALANLARKAAGQDVGWINIADAQALALSGFAQRDRQGWHITPEGAALLKQEHLDGAHTQGAND